MTRTILCLAVMLGLILLGQRLFDAPPAVPLGVDSQPAISFPAAEHSLGKVIAINDVAVYARPGDEAGISLLQPGTFYWVHDEAANDSRQFVRVGLTSNPEQAKGWGRRDELCFWGSGRAIRPRQNLRISATKEQALAGLPVDGESKIVNAAELSPVISNANIAMPVLESQPLVVSGKRYRVVNVALVDLEKQPAEVQEKPTGAKSQLDVVMLLPIDQDFGARVSQSAELLTKLETTRSLRLSVVLYGGDFGQPVRRVLDENWRGAIEELHAVPVPSSPKAPTDLNRAIMEAVATPWGKNAVRMLILAAPRSSDDAVPMATLQFHRVNVLQLFDAHADPQNDSIQNGSRWLHVENIALGLAVGGPGNPASWPHDGQRSATSHSAAQNTALSSTGWCILPEEEYIAMEQILVRRDALDDLLSIVGLLRASMSSDATAQDHQRAVDESIWILPGTLDAILAARSIPTAFNSSLRFSRDELRQRTVVGDQAMHQHLTDVEGSLTTVRNSARWFGPAPQQQYGFVPATALP